LTNKKTETIENNSLSQIENNSNLLIVQSSIDSESFDQSNISDVNSSNQNITNTFDHPLIGSSFIRGHFKEV